MDLAGIQASTKMVLSEVPELEGFIEGIRLKITESVKVVISEAMQEVADGVGQIVQLGYSIDGMTMDFEVEQIVVSPIKAKFTISMPLKGKS